MQIVSRDIVVYLLLHCKVYKVASYKGISCCMYLSLQMKTGTQKVHSFLQHMPLRDSWLAVMTVLLRAWPHLSPRCFFIFPELNVIFSSQAKKDYILFLHLDLHQVTISRKLNCSFLPMVITMPKMSHEELLLW